MDKGEWFDDSVYEDFSDYDTESKELSLRDWQRRAKNFFFENDGKAIFEVTTGAGKSMISVDIIADLLEKYPDMKFLIVVPKNVILETGWYKELVDYGIPIQKIGVYYGDVKEYAQITLTNMQSINRIPLEIFDMLVADECFTGDTKVKLMHKNKAMDNEHGYITETTIRGIVEQKSKGPVISFNTKTKNFELKKIINWYKIPNKKKLIKLTFNDNTIISVTPEQEFYDGYKYIKALDIKKNDNVIYFGKYPNIIINEDIKQLVISGILGDGHIQKVRKKARIKFSCIHEEYTQLKKDILNVFEDNNLHKILNCGYVKCIKKEIIYNEDFVYDIEVEDNHNFIANELLVHNCHNYGTEKTLTFLKHPFKYKLGLSATLKRMDNKHYDIMKIFNYNIFKYAPKEALSDGILNPFDFENIGIMMDSKSMTLYDELTQQLNAVFQSGGNYNTIMRSTSPLKLKMLSLINERKALVNNYPGKFNVARDIIKKHRNNKIIVFNQFNDQTSKMYWYLLEDDIKCRIVHSGIKKDKREQALRDFKNDKFNVLLTSKVLDEGYNLPKLDVAIIMAGDSTNKQTVQRMGRVLRKKKHGNSKLYQIYCLKTLEARNAKTRAKIFKKLSSDYIEHEYTET